MNIDQLCGKRVAVCGIGISNLPLIDFLLAHGASVTARDRKSREDAGEKIISLENKGVRLVLGDGYLDGLDEEIIFRSPGMRPDRPEFLRAVENGAVLTSEMQLFLENCPATVIGITGSDGKTTTTTLISKLIGMQYGNVYVGGNIGKPLLPYVEQMKKEDFAVVELSSFQLQQMPVSVDIAVVTNVSPNHLDWHTGMDEYIEAKKNIFRHPGCKKLVINGANAVTDGFDAYVPEGCRVLKFMSHGGVWEEQGMIFCEGEPVLRISDIKIPGHHNVENYMAATGAVYGLVDKENIVKLAREFGGVEHRIEFVRELDGVKYYNSSIDSSPTRTIAALSSFDEKLTVICGGYDKHIPFEPLAEPLCRKAKRLILTGATAGKIKAAVTGCKEFRESGLEILEEPDFEKAVKLAHDTAKSGDTVILSPACASFDAFPNFEVRGRKFKETVNSFE